MNRDDLQRISRLRVKEARALRDKGFYSGAYYLLGYAVECALKACIAKQIMKYDFPDKNMINQSYTHDLLKLLRVAGLEIELKDEMDVNPDLKLNWSVVTDWTEHSRYEHHISRANILDFFMAVTSSKNGVLRWLKKYW